jgi:hypothetical protein
VLKPPHRCTCFFTPARARENALHRFDLPAEGGTSVMGSAQAATIARWRARPAAVGGESCPAHTQTAAERAAAGASPSHSGELYNRLYVLRRLPGWQSPRKPGSMTAEIDIGLVAALTGGWHSVHTKAQDATRTVCGERIGHGLLLLAVERGPGGVNACLMFKRR